MKRRIGQTLAFATITALCGLLVAGLLLPLTVAASSATNAVASASLKFPMRMPATTSPAGRSELLFADGTHLAWFFDRNRVLVPLSGIAPVMRQAQLAIENHRFYQQGALDLSGLGRALVGNLTTGGAAGGGSGITQQYVKMLRIEQALQDNNSAAVSTAQERTLTRKVEELRYAVNIEQLETKDQILAGYLNLAYYGDGAYGIEAAAEHYFSRHATQLTLPQAALLAGIVKSPTAYNPLTHPSEALRRRNTVLNRMAQLGMITRTQAAIASRQHFDKHLTRTIVSGCQATPWPFLCDAARRELLASPELGVTLPARRALLYRGSLTIRTTINRATQDAAQTALSGTVAPKDPAIAVMSLVQPGTGRVLTMAQSRPVMTTRPGGTWYSYPQTTASGGAEGYQAGSTFKTLTLAAALEQGISPATTFPAPATLALDGDTYRSCSGTFTFAGHHTVGNLGGEAFGTIDLAQATQHSVNTYYLRLAQRVGLCAIANMGDRLGVQRVDGRLLTGTADDVPTLTLGPIEVAPLSIANAYATLAAHGLRCQTTFIDSITRNRHTTNHQPTCVQVLAPAIADKVTDILHTVMTNGSGREASIPSQPAQAGKTGTTDDNQTVWFAGYTPQLAGAAMIAIDKRHPWWNTHRKSLKGIRLPASGTWLEGTGGGDAGRDLWRPCMIVGLEALTP